jgi:hypothetical protein
MTHPARKTWSAEAPRPQRREALESSRAIQHEHGERGERHRRQASRISCRRRSRSGGPGRGARVLAASRDTFARATVIVARVVEGLSETTI